MLVLMQMTLRTRALLSVTVTFWAAVGFAIASALAHNELYSIVYGGLAFIIFVPINLWLFSSFRCPVCGTSVFDRGPFFVAFWPARTCSKCGTDLKNR